MNDMGGVVTEEQAISWAQYLDLEYSQSGTLYDLIPQAPRPSTDPAKPLAETLFDGIVGSIQSPSIAKPAKKPQKFHPYSFKSQGFRHGKFHSKYTNAR